MSIRVLFIGEIVGKAGVYCVKKVLPTLRRERTIDLVVGNADGVTAGYGLGWNHSAYLRKLGIDIITTGDQVYFKKDMVANIDQAPHVLRGANLPAANPGRAWRITRVTSADGPTGGVPVAVVSLLGMAGFYRMHPGNPFNALPELVERLKKDTPIIFIDFHSVTTAEKVSMGLYADGYVTGVLGTGMRVLTADAEVLPHGTAVITDTGRTGSLDSVGGLLSEIEVRKFLTGVPERSAETWEGLEFQGVIVDADSEGRATAIEPLRIPVAPVPAAQNAPPSTEADDD